VVDITDDAFSDGTIIIELRAGDVHDGGLATGFDVSDGDGCGAGGGPAEEVQMEGEAVGLVEGGEGGGEMEGDGALDARCYEAAVRD
jgi:hypothetical protein